MWGKSCNSAPFQTPCWEGTCTMHHAPCAMLCPQQPYILCPSRTIHPTALLLLSWDTVPLCIPVSNLKSSFIVFQKAGMASICYHSQLTYNFQTICYGFNIHTTEDFPVRQWYLWVDSTTYISYIQWFNIKLYIWMELVMHTYNLRIQGAKAGEQKVLDHLEWHRKPSSVHVQEGRTDFQQNIF